jgi:hypothetical protein
MTIFISSESYWFNRILFENYFYKRKILIKTNISLILYIYLSQCLKNYLCLIDLCLMLI